LRARELRNLTKDELATRLADSRKELFTLRFQSATGALENTMRLKLTRRELARILTVQQERSARAGLEG
jgi:large subunit ribosomal protein L29